MRDGADGETRSVVAGLWNRQLKRFYGRISEEDLGRFNDLFDCSIARVYLKAGKSGPVRRQDVVPDLQRIDHVADWLVSAITGKAHWLSKADPHGRPKKLMKCGTIDALHREAETGFRKQRNSVAVASPAAVGDGEEVFMALADGWRIVRMRTPEALDRESREMQHCIGGGAYDAAVRKPDVALLSLRDPSNGPHVTVDLDIARNVLREVRGKQNALPKREYADIMRPFFARYGHWCRETGGTPGLLFGPEGEAHYLAELPEGAVIRELCNLSQQGLRLLPARMVVKGGLALRDLDLSGLFSRGLDGFVVEGKTDLRYSTFSVFPARHGFRGDIDLSGAMLGGIGEGFRCHGSLTLAENRRLRSMPLRMVVGGDLMIRDVPLEALPPLLSVGGNLSVRDTRIRKLPPGLRVGGKVTFQRW